MPCCGGSSAVVIRGEGDVTVSGSGTVSDPYVVTGDIDLSIRALQTPTINTTIVGSGTSDDPYVISADLVAGLSDLTDVQITTTPTTGWVVLWDGSAWVAGPAPTQEPGAVNVGGGIEGDGTVGDPIQIKVSNLVDDSPSGLYTYIDSAGELRAQMPSSSTSWAAITGKPSTFPPSAHTHPNSDLTGLLTGTAAPGSGLGVDGSWYAQYTP